jgi:NAD(P)-dependent dehydrogenase (short-subunit alcohol dehydrogenase family)
MSSLFTLKDKNIIITGASSGIGRECSIMCSQMGANVVLLARNEKRLDAVHKSLSQGENLYFSVDLRDTSKFASILTASVSKLGPISGFVHSAGVEFTMPIRDLTVDIYQELLSINVISCFELARAISSKRYIDIRGSSFVFISSVAGIVGRPGILAYSASKGALISGARAMAVEFAKKRINVNTVSPGLVQTPLLERLLARLDDAQKKKRLEGYPLGIGKPLDVASACIFLLSDAARWITGTNLIVDGGYTAH